MRWVPGPSKAVNEIEMMPFTIGVDGPTGVEPSTFDPSEKVTAPLIWGKSAAICGIWTDRGTVKVTKLPATDGFVEEARTPRLVESWAICTVDGEEVVLPRKL